MKKEKSFRKMKKAMRIISKMQKFIFVLCVLLIISVAMCHFEVRAAGTGVDLPKNTGLPENDLPTILDRLVNWMLYIFGLVAIISFILTGIMYLLGGSMRGEKKDVSGAKKQLQWSITGVIVGLSGYIVLKAVDTWFRGSSSF